MEDVSGAANRDQRHKGRLLHLILPPYLFHNFNSVFQERRHSFDVEVPIHFVNFVSLDFLPNSFFVYSSHSFSFLMRFVLGQTFCQPFLPMLWAHIPHPRPRACLNSWSYPCCCPFDPNMLLRNLLQIGQRMRGNRKPSFFVRFPKTTLELWLQMPHSIVSPQIPVFSFTKSCESLNRKAPNSLHPVVLSKEQHAYINIVWF